MAIINEPYPGRTTFLRPPTLAIVAVVVALLLSGCSAGRGADSETTKARLLAYPGIASSRVHLGESMDGFTVSRYVSIVVTLEPGYVAGDADALADWLFRTAWSVNDKKLDGALVSVQAANGDPVAWDYWPAALEQFGLPQSEDPAASRSDYEVTGIIGATAEELESVIGPWPADIPEFTDDLIVNG